MASKPESRLLRSCWWGASAFVFREAAKRALTEASGQAAGLAADFFLNHLRAAKESIIIMAARNQAGQIVVKLTTALWLRSVKLAAAKAWPAPAKS